MDHGVKVRVLPGTSLPGEVNKLIRIFGKKFGINWEPVHVKRAYFLDVLL